MCDIEQESQAVGSEHGVGAGDEIRERTTVGLWCFLLFSMKVVKKKKSIVFEAQLLDLYTFSIHFIIQ